MRTKITILCALTLLMAGGAFAAEGAVSYWGGHHGNLYLSIGTAPEITSSATAEPRGEMGALVTVHAVLSDIEPLLFKGARILDVGGFEMKLEVIGADDYKILKQTIPTKSLNVSNDPAECTVGLYDSISIMDGAATLVSWQVLIKGDAKNVMFRLSSDQLFSAPALEGCVESETTMIWAGAFNAGQQGLLFSAGYVPAYLNWDGETDLTPVRGTVTWQETGLFTIAE